MADIDIGDYCRRVEDHLTQANAGHLVRIVGPGFELVRRWAETGVPLSVVYRGIDMKAERHRAGSAKRPLRIEFCEGDVDNLFENWRRAIGLTTGRIAESGGVGEPVEAESPKRPSLSRHIDRAIDRLTRAQGRLEWPVELRDVCDRVLQQLAELRRLAAKARGPARDELIEQLAPLDAELASAIQTHMSQSVQEAARADAAADLAPYQGRLPADVWQRSLEITTDRLLRDRLGLPVIAL